MANANLFSAISRISRLQRYRCLQQSGCTVWFTGLSASGKTTTAYALEKALMEKGYAAYVLDGDNIRQGLNQDLSFSSSDREENIRRVSEVAKLFADAGIIVIVSFISPYHTDRLNARLSHQKLDLAFFEVFIDTPLSICEARDPKGLYRKAREGEISNFTGIDAPYEKPIHPDFILKTHENKLNTGVKSIIDALVIRGLLNHD